MADNTVVRPKGNKVDKILITTSAFGKDDEAILAALRDAGYEAVLNPYGRKLTEEEVRRLLTELMPVGIIAGVEPLTAGVLASIDCLRVISRCGSGMDTVDLQAARKKGIAVLNTPDGPTRAVAELTIGLMFGLLRHIPFVDRELRKGNWLKETGNLLRGKKVGIIGVGRIGKKVAELLRPFDVRISGADLQPDYVWFKANDILPATLEEIIAEADIISLHLSHLGGSSRLLGEKEFSTMKKGAFILNLSRGDVIDEVALFEALSSGKIAGAALDVFSKEPYDGPLKKLDNVILTPHIGSYAREARIEMEMQAVSNLLKALGHNIE